MFRRMQKQINSAVIKQDDLYVHFGSNYHGKRRGAGLLGSCPFLQVVRGELYKLEEEEKSPMISHGGTTQYPHYAVYVSSNPWLV